MGSFMRQTMTSRMLHIGLATVCLATLFGAAVWPTHGTAQQLGRQAAASGRIVITGTQAVALGEPQVHVLLRKGGQVITGAAGGKLLDNTKAGEKATSFRAVLDTGAGMHLISQRTASRFGLSVRAGDSYNIFGINGALTVVASAEYDLAVAGAT